MFVILNLYRYSVYPWLLRYCVIAKQGTIWFRNIISISQLGIDVWCKYINWNCCRVYSYISLTECYTKLINWVQKLRCFMHSYRRFGSPISHFISFNVSMCLDPVYFNNVFPTSYAVNTIFIINNTWYVLFRIDICVYV